MEKETNRPPIWIGPILWEDLRDKAFLVNAMEDALNDRFALSDYGSGIRSIHFVPFVLPPSNTLHEEEISYASRKKAFICKVKLDYTEAGRTNDAGFRAMLAHRFLLAIDAISNYQVKDFDWQRFRKDVQKLFEEKGWFQPTELV